MQQVLKLRIIGKSGIEDTDLTDNLHFLFRKKGIPIKMFSDILRTALVDIQEHGGILTLRFDWDV